jgi:hypothetical protein
LPNKFWSFEAFSLKVRAGDWPAGLDIAKLKITPERLVELWLGLSLAKPPLMVDTFFLI